MNGAAVVHGDRAGRTDGVLRPLDRGAGDVGVGECTDPAVAVVQVEERPVVTPGDESDLAHARLDIFEEDADREQVVVRVRPELDVLVPLHFLAAVRGFEVELRVMELDVGSEQIDRDVDDDRLRRELPVRVVEIGG